MELLSLQNAIGQLVNYFMLIESSESFEFMSFKEIIRRGVLYKNLGLLNVLMAVAFTALVVISYYFGDFNRELSIAMMIIFIAGFGIPYLIYHSFDEQSIE
jgi:hypothetical protein